MSLAIERAFPRPASVDTTHGSLPDGDRVREEQEGMSYREWVAGMILSGFAAAPSDDLPNSLRSIAKSAVEWADALIAALE